VIPTAYTAGLSMGLSLIVAIGAQNAFVLRQGLLRRHVFAVCLTCAVSDAILITLGVTSFAQVAAVLPWLDPVMRWGGALFLVWYGIKSFRSALRSTEALATDGEGAGEGDFRRTLLTCLAFTWLNPHVYLDTVVLLGSISTQFEGQAASFGLGAATGSFLFFFGLGYGAAWLRPVFAKPQAWRLLEGGIGVVMWAIAGMLVRG
jgi:L-lysine exporter family protein LysE/ArgO